MEKSLWRNLIYLWCETKGKYGLTLPFLVGAEREFGRGEDFDISQLFKELQLASQPYCISRCDDLEEFIIGLPKREYPFLKSLQRYGSLYINTPFLEHLDSIGHIQEQLALIYEKYIELKKYSKNIGYDEWGYFDEYDEISIREAIEL